MIPLHVRPVGAALWCRLLGVGALGAVTVCRARIEPRALLQICCEPPAVDRCSACERELELRPRYAVLFDVEDLDDAVMVDASQRATTREIRKPEAR